MQKACTLGHGGQSFRQEDPMKIMMLAVSLLISLPIGFEASAQNQRGREDSTEYVFENDIVSGELLRPDTTIVTSRQPGNSRSLIKVRSHFIPEMFKTVEDI